MTPTANIDVLARILAQVDRQPCHPAVVSDEGTVSYGALGASAWRLAASLAALADGPRVLIHLPQGADAYAAMLGSALAGGVYAPINQSAPLARQRMVFERFQPDAIVTDAACSAAVAALRPDVPVFDIDALPARQLSAPRPAHELIYVMFTPGSTGVPKGVMVPRRALSHYVGWALDAMAIGPDDRWSQHPNVAFDLSVLDIFGALAGGATLYPLSGPHDRMMPARAIARHRLTVWNSVPSVIDMMRQAKQATRDSLASLRLATFCGEPLLAPHLETLFAARPDLRVHNTYGPTEATVSCTLLTLGAETWRAATRDSVAVGEAIPGMGLHLLGDDPASGEIAITGSQLARGYWRDETATARAFRNIVVDGATVPAYLTGDRGVLHDGQLYFEGRLDHQVKVRGHRVELGAIDHAIREFGAVAACTVKQGEALTAYVQAPPGLDVAGLQAYLATRLMEHERPRSIELVDEIPRNANDKIDRRAVTALRRPDTAHVA